MTPVAILQVWIHSCEHLSEKVARLSRPGCRKACLSSGPKTFGQNTGGIPIPGLSSTGPQPPGPAHGCMSRDPNDPQVNLKEKPIEQLRDCLSLLAPPLRLAQIA